jgi:predicted aspartyl protease
MIEIDPQDRLLHASTHRGPFGVVITLIVIAIIIFGAGGFYWIFVSQKFSDVYRTLNIVPLPITVELRPAVYSRLDQLKREPCDREAILPLADLMADAGYPRESAKSLTSFAGRCGSSVELLEPAYDSLVRLGDFKGAIDVANQLIKLSPAIPDYRYWRGEAYESLKDYKAALSDYISTLQLFKNLRNVSVKQYYAISRMYAEIGRPCDAITPLEMYLRYDVAARQTAQIAQLISEWATQGNCRASHAAGSDKVLLAPDNIIDVVVNGVRARMVLDTGATIVSMTPSFASRAKIVTDEQNMMTIGVVGGVIQSAPGYANLIEVGKSRAADVPVAVSIGRDNAFGPDLDGLLGMTFLARFVVTVSPGSLELKPRTLD